MTFYHQSIESVYHEFQTGLQGISEAEHKKRLVKFGPNHLKEKKKKPAWILFLGQFKDFMIMILAAAAVVSGIVGDLTDTLIILVIIVLNALLGFVQEFRAEKAMQSLKTLTETQSKVIRSGKTTSISATEIVPGDLILLEAGNKVPADIRLVETFALKVDESSLTGESVPVDKTPEPILADHPDLGDQFNMAFKGTLITNGRATGIAVATGMQTEIGKIADLLQENRPSTPLQQRMKRFGKVVSILILIICGLLFLAGVMRGEDIFPVLLLSVSLAVAAIPEALPALSTISLSLGAARLAKKNALIRKLPAVESLGSVTFICTDKTGTLTQNKMTVVTAEPSSSKTLWNQTAQEFETSPLEICMGLNHDVHLGPEGNPEGESTELALVEYFLKKKSLHLYEQLQRDFPREKEIPFDSLRKRMTTIHPIEGGYLILCKGAAESIAEILNDPKESQTLEIKAQALAKEGQRVLAFAGKTISEIPSTELEIESGLELFGYVGLIDPPREEVKESIKECQTAGIKVVMITGDHPETARAIAEEVGIWKSNDLVLSGKELAQLSEKEFTSKVESVTVYARVAPDQKLKIVQALQKKGHFVSMTGDGVNDAPSLRSSNIGVAMGISGTDVSKEASHMVLLDDNFSTIVKAVKEGRRIYDNIVKFIKYIMTCNGAEIWTIGLAPFLGFPNPLLPIHILWINLITDGLPALALAGERSEKDIMKRPPRPSKQSLFAEGVGIHIIWVGILMASVTLFSQYWSIRQGWHWQTIVFSVLSFSQLGHVLAVRSSRTLLYKQGLLTNRPLLLAVTFTFLLQVSVIYLPIFNRIFRTQPLTWTEWIFSVGMALIVFHGVELEKIIRKKIADTQP
jgi:P-type Ca2+ transporter type 2C